MNESRTAPGSAITRRATVPRMAEEPYVPAPTVLLVADHADDRQMYSEYLRMHRCRVVEIGNTEQALTVAPMADVIITGIRVRGPFDGLELVRRLRADDRTRTKPIIVLTACAFATDRENARQAGSDMFLAKPCLPQTLLTEIGGVLPGRLPRLRAAGTTVGGSKRRIA